MVEGFWLVHAEGREGNSGGGVVVFVNGKIYGGDSGFYYIGTYQGYPVVKARVAVHQFDKSVPNILGVDGDYELTVSATVSGDTMTGTAMIPGIPNESMAIRLVKKSNL
jgi:hypothetical protein